MKTKLTAAIIGALALLTPFAASAKGKGKGKNKPIDEVQDYLKDHDKNKNGSIERSECSASDTTFQRVDENHDGKLNKAELAVMLHAPEPKPKKK